MNIMNYITWEMILIVIAVNLFVDFVKLRWKPNNWVIRLFVFVVAVSVAYGVSEIPGVQPLGFFQGLAIGLLSIILYDSGGYPWVRGQIKGLFISIVDGLKKRFGGGA